MFDIIHQADDFVLINKHPGVSVHKDDGDTMLLEEVGKVTGDAQLYLIHRLDKVTSGILLLGRTQKAASALASLFAERRVEKYYLAIASKKPKKKQGLIRGDMVRSRRASWMLTDSQNNPAVTQFISRAGEVGERIILCRPYTGKTHQIRVALKSIGAPILGDPIYNARATSDRSYLHAYGLCFEYAGEQHRFVMPPCHGEKWQAGCVCEALAAWESPWELNWPQLNKSNK